jgi:uncharacterized protein YbjT (DUF2867 family)
VLLNHPFRDKDKMETFVRHSALAWMIVRPTRLTDGPATGHYRTGERLPLGLSPSISRADVADFLLEQVTRTLLKKPASGARVLGGDRKEWGDART